MTELEPRADGLATIASIYVRFDPLCRHDYGWEEDLETGVLDVRCRYCDGHLSVPFQAPAVAR
jgi:hypothetical protein